MAFYSLDDHHIKQLVEDGVNDALAFASATVGIAMGGAGTDTGIRIRH